MLLSGNLNLCWHSQKPGIKNSLEYIWDLTCPINPPYNILTCLNTSSKLLYSAFLLIIFLQFSHYTDWCQQLILWKLKSVFALWGTPGRINFSLVSLDYIPFRQLARFQVIETFFDRSLFKELCFWGILKFILASLVICNHKKLKYTFLVLC